MSYKTPAYNTLTGLKGIDKRIETIAGHMTDLTWLSYSFGLTERDVSFKDGKENIIPTIYQEINAKDPLSLMPSDLYDAFSFWVKEPEGIFSSNSTRLKYKVSCIFFCDLKQIAPSDNYKVTKTRIRQDILRFFRTHENAGFGQLNIISIIDDDITQVYKGFTLNQIDNKYRMLPKYAIRVNFELSFLHECESYNSFITKSAWYLPSQDEFEQIDLNLIAHSVGGFSGNYWTSTEEDATNAIYYSTGTASVGLKSNSYKVRAVRTFTEEIGKYNLRDTGPGGGLVFYVSGTTYYEAAKIDQSSGTKWSNLIDKEVTGTETAIGTGLANTALIMAQTCVHDDYFLASRNLLQQMDINLHAFGVGSFSNAYYYSSSEMSDVMAWVWDFQNNINFLSLKSDLQRVRACRFFTSIIGAYNLRDTGPAGGLIFYVHGQEYYECPLIDQSAGKFWSNITTVLIGTTSTDINEGQNNTNEIITQAGHTDSSAKLCDDFTTSYNHINSAAKLCNDYLI